MNRNIITSPFTAGVILLFLYGTSSTVNARNRLEIAQSIIGTLVEPCNTIAAEDITEFQIKTDDDAEKDTFSIKDAKGTKFVFEVNPDKYSVTLTSGIASGTETLNIPGIVENAGSKYSVTGIASFAFQTYSTFKEPIIGVKHVIIPEGIVRMGQSCFGAAPDLISVSLPASLREIPYSAFYGCKKLRSVTLPIQSRLSSIGSFAFADCKSLQSFLIPETVQHIGEGPWRNCVSLKSLEIGKSNRYYHVNDGVLYSSARHELIQYPAGKRNKSYDVEYGTTAIENSAFYGNPYIRKVRLPASLEYISHIAFFDCRRLEEVTLNSVLTSIGNKAFRECPSLKEIILYGDPRYNEEEGEEPGSYRTFGLKTRVVKMPFIQPSYRDSKKESRLLSAFKKTCLLPGFTVKPIKRNGDYGYADYMGKGKWTGYGNASPKEDVLQLLNGIPVSMLGCEKVDHKGRITRLYLDKSNPKDPKVLFCRLGIGGNDLIVAYFEKGDLPLIEALLEDLNR